MKFRRQQIAFILLCIYIIAICLLCIIDFSNFPTKDIQWGDFPIDKLIHFLMFLPFPILAFATLEDKKMDMVKSLIHLVIIFCIGLLLAFSTEVIQRFTETRRFELMDFAADGAGLLLSSIIIFIIIYKKNYRQDA